MTRASADEDAARGPAPGGDEGGTRGRFTPGAWRLATLPVLLALPLALFVPLAVPVVALVGVVAVLLFHRDPDRDPPASGVLAPADGRISVVREDADGRLRVGTFMSPFDVHVNRAPRNGTVETVEHRPGAHKPAFSKDSERNERVHLEYASGYEVDLIAGAFARRIHPYVEPGADVARGERIGHISFGSRVDVVFPAAVDRADLAVDEGETVRAGETVLAAIDHDRSA